MRSKLFQLLLLLLVGNASIKANGNNLSKIIRATAVLSDSLKTDSGKAEFDLRKKNTRNLVKGKGTETIINYYRFYLQEKDKRRADSILNDLLRKDIAIDYKYKISLISNFYTSDTKTKMLFLADAGRIKEYREFFLKQKTSNLKSNVDIRAHDYNLVALDSALYQIAPDSLLKLQMARHYNSLAWYSIVTQKLGNVRFYLNQSLKYDPGNRYPVANLPLLLLLQNHFDEARALYLNIKISPLTKRTLPLKKNSWKILEN